MIITKQKSGDELFAFLSKARKVILLGCSECATFCKTGGMEQLLEFEEKLKARGAEVVARRVLEPACNTQVVRKALREMREQLTEADSIVSFTCGDGTQTVAKLVGQMEHTVHISVYPGNETLFIGETVRAGEYVEACRACGRCELGWTGGICPTTQCAKGLLNGPCGGAKGRQCEVNPGEECVWLRICDRLEALGQLENLLEIRPPRDYLKNTPPRRHAVERPRRAEAQGAQGTE